MMTFNGDYNPIIEEAIIPFSAYSDEIEALCLNLRNNPPGNHLSNVVNSILNGETSAALQRLVPIEARKEAGLFFTSSEISEKAASILAPILQSGIRVIDPACGAGNLLLACARHLPKAKSLSDTLKLWSNSLMGYDLYPEFIRAARLRLLLLAAGQHPNENHIDQDHPKDLFENLKARNTFSHLPLPSDTCIVVNPPFGYMASPDDCKWSKGKIQTAAWFLERLIQHAYDGQHIVAILPDVLRSGTRYHKWRNTISSRCSYIHVEPAGRFDQNTDVDVFIMHGIVGEGESWPYASKQRNIASYTVADFFDVHVGAVVPHRDPIDGESYPYIHARTALPWRTLDHISEKRRTIRTVFTPPFVVVHRTSSPSDKHRCLATIVNDKRKIAVENHLIVLLPQDKSLETCKSLLNQLKSPKTTEWFNQRIRCRHLTVSSVKGLPWIGQTPVEVKK